MNWWIQQLVEVVKGLLIFIIGFYISLKYIVPKMSRDTAVATAEAILTHPKIQPAIAKLKRYEKELEPLIEKVKELDLQELIDLAKSVKVFIEVQTNKAEPPPPPQKK